jgi:hypothetical protein
MYLEKGKKAVPFLKKSNQKTFAYCGLWQRRCQSPQERKSFCRPAARFFFFRKRSSSL